MFGLFRKKELRLMVVDDDMSICQAFKRQAYGHSIVEPFDNPHVALKEVRAGLHYSAILSDLRMPNMDGLTFLARARALAPAMPLFLFTGALDHAEIRSRLLEIGVRATFFKPLNSVTVIDEVLRSLRQHP
jgi:DNA-binding NtrC family response regulator